MKKDCIDHKQLLKDLIALQLLNCLVINMLRNTYQPLIKEVESGFHGFHNKEPTRLKTPLEAIKLPEVKHLSSSKSRPERLLPPGVKVRYLYQPGELEGGERRRATDHIWSLNTYEISQVMPHSQPIFYYLHDAPKRGFVREELLVVPDDTQLPPSTLK